MHVTGEWAPDYTTPERAALTSIYSQRGGSVELLIDYVMAQVTAGVVPLPDFLKREPEYHEPKGVPVTTRA